MTAAALIERASGLGVELTVDGDVLRYRAPAEVLTDDLLADLKAHKPEIMALLVAEDDATAESVATWAAMTEDVRRAARREGAPVDEVVASLGDCELADWRAGQFGPAEMAAFASAVRVRVGMERGERPAHYNEIATCRHCGPVWLWARGEVLGCPWCFNRVAGRPIPRPVASQCGDCVHFLRQADHQHLGHCAVGEMEDANGLWDTDQRYCLRAERP